MAAGVFTEGQGIDLPARNRRHVMLALAVVAAACGFYQTVAIAAGMAWTQIPAITVVGTVDDSRLPLVRDAVAFWNRTSPNSAPVFASAWWTLRLICACLESFGQ